MLYMSPEQWGGVVDHQSDLWACGILFWRALVRLHPAGTSKIEKLKTRLADLDTPLPSLGSKDPTLPESSSRSRIARSRSTRRTATRPPPR